VPEGQTVGSRRRSLTVRIAPQSPFLTSLPVALHARLPTVSPVGDYSLHPRSHPLGERGSNSAFNMNSRAYLAANFRAQLQKRSI